MIRNTLQSNVKTSIIIRVNVCRANINWAYFTIDYISLSHQPYYECHFQKYCHHRHHHHCRHCWCDVRWDYTIPPNQSASLPNQSISQSVNPSDIQLDGSLEMNIGFYSHIKWCSYLLCLLNVYLKHIIFIPSHILEVLQTTCHSLIYPN